MITRWILLATLFLCIKVGFSQHQFHIEGHCGGMVEGNLVYLIYKHNGQRFLDSVQVKDQRFTFNGTVNTVTSARLYYNENPMLIEVATDYKDIFLENSKITIHSPQGTLKEAILSGSHLNDMQQKFDEYVKGLNLDWENNEMESFEKYINGQFDFIQQYPHSPYSIIRLASISPIQRYVDRTIAAFDQLDDGLKTGPEAKIIRDNIEKHTKLGIGDKAFAFTIPDITRNQSYSLADFEGQYVLIDFWASWCLPCREDNQKLKRTYNIFNEQGFEIISISIDGNEHAWKKAIQDDELPWVQLSNLLANRCPTYLAYGVTNIPANFLIDPQGTVIAKNIKEKELNELLENRLLTN